MQKVVGSSPISRSPKGLQIGLFAFARPSDFAGHELVMTREICLTTTESPACMRARTQDLLRRTQSVNGFERECLANARDTPGHSRFSSKAAACFPITHAIAILRARLRPRKLSKSSGA
jgi:hypothetical protein